MKHMRIVLIALITLSAAFTTTTLRAANLLKPNGLSFEAGKIQEKDGRADLFFASIIPQFSFGHVTTVLNINYVATSKFKIRDGGRDFIVLDQLHYKDGDKFSLHYGEIKNLTIGSGFIVSNYRSDILGNVPLNRQRGIVLDLKTTDSNIQAFGTQSDLFGIRGVRRFGSLRLGATAVTDSNPNFHEVGIDIETDFKGDRIKAYADAAKIIKHGNGMALGVIVKPWKPLSVKAELRNYNADFLPSMIDEHYEAITPFSKIAGSGRINGMYYAIDFCPNAETSLGLTYERYRNRRPRATIKVRGRIGSRLSGDIFYAQENNVLKGGWSNPNNHIVRGILTFKLNEKLDVIIDYFHAYDDTLKKQESLTFKARVNLF